MSNLSQTPPLLGTPSPRRSAAVWAMTDLVFQLLIVFVVSVSVEPALRAPLDAETSRHRGDAVPELGKRLELRVLYLGGRTTSDPEAPADEELDEELFVLQLGTVPESDLARELRVPGRARMIATLAHWEEELEALRKTYPDHFVERTLLAPPDVTWEPVLRTVAALRRRTGSVWSAGLLDRGRVAEPKTDEEAKSDG